MGLLDLIFGRIKETKSHPLNFKEAAPMALRQGLYFLINNDARLKKASELQVQATLHKDTNDWYSAIKCLRESERLIDESGGGYPMATYLRLPLFLQQAGRFNEAILEFERLLGEIDSRVNRHFSHKGIKFRRKLAHADRAVTYEKMALSCKRQKLPELEARYLALKIQNRQAHAKLMRELDSEDEVGS